MITCIKYINIITLLNFKGLCKTVGKLSCTRTLTKTSYNTDQNVFKQQTNKFTSCYLSIYLHILYNDNNIHICSLIVTNNHYVSK